MDIGNPELTREDGITTVKKRPPIPKRINNAKERKSLLNTGEKYINRSGHVVAARSVWVGCNQNTCRIRCKDEVSEVKS